MPDLLFNSLLLCYILIKLNNLSSIELRNKSIINSSLFIFNIVKNKLRGELKYF